MNTPQLIATCGASALFLAACVLGIAQHHMANQETVEAEQEKSREVAAHASWWNGVTTQADDHPVAFSLDTIDDRDQWLIDHGIGQSPRPAA